MTQDEFEEAIAGCDCSEANVMGFISVGAEEFSFDCDMMGPAGRVCVSGVLNTDGDGLVTGVESLVFRDFSEMGECGSYEDAPIIDDSDEIGGILDVLASRFTHDGGPEGELPDGDGFWSL